LIVRTNRGEAPTASAVSKVIASFDPQLAVMEMGSPELERAAAFAQERLLASLLSGFGLLAALLATVGLYGLTAYTTEGRRREFGIRLALGASPVDLARGVISQGLRITAAGLALGGLLTAGTGRAISAYLFGVGLLDPATLGGLLVAFSVITVAAALQPAFRAAATDPIEALRAE
jgi:ABC-type antimicrobial peptide transport system permease subunit